MLRRIVTSTVLAAVAGSVLAASVLFARADGPTSTVSIDNFSFGPQTVTVKTGTTVTWTNKDDIPHGIASANNAFKKGPALDTDESFSLIGEGRMNGHRNGNGYKGWARRQARRRNGHG
jgi:plastocyanin